MQEAAAPQVEVPGAPARSDDECGVVGKAPFGPDLRPVVRPLHHLALEPTRAGHELAKAERASALGTRPITGDPEPFLEFVDALPVRIRCEVGVEQLDDVSGGGVQRGHEPRG